MKNLFTLLLFGASLIWADKEASSCEEYLSAPLEIASSQFQKASRLELDSLFDQFKPATSKDFNRFSPKPFWIKLSVCNNNALYNDLVVELRNSFPDFVTAFWQDQKGNWHTKSMGSRTRKYGSSPHPFLSLDLEYGQKQDLFFHIQTESLLYFPFRVLPQEKHALSLHNIGLEYGIFLGILSFSLVLGVLYLFAFKNTTYLWYMFSCCSLVLANMYNSGYFGVFFPFDFGLFDNTILLFFFYLYVAANIKFTFEYLGGKSLGPRFTKLFKVAYIPFILAFTSLFHFPSYLINVYFLHFALPVYNLTLALVALYVYFKYKIPTIQILIISQFILSLAYIIAGFDTLGLSETNFLTIYAPEISALLFTVLTGSGLTLQIRNQRKRETTDFQATQHAHLKNLREQEQRLRSNLNQKSHITHVISHNLRSPLASLSGLVDLMLRSKPSTEILERIPPLIQSMERQIIDLNELLNYDEEIPLEPVPVFSIANQVLETLEEKIIRHRVHLTLQIGPELKVLGNPALLFSILLNLIDNSIKYRHGDRVCTIKIFSKHVDSKEEIHYIDNGMGIDFKKHGDRVFKLYSRLTQKGTGTGKGLYLCKVQMEQMKGEIALIPPEKNGCYFKLTFKSVSANSPLYS